MEFSLDTKALLVEIGLIFLELRDEVIGSRRVIVIVGPYVSNLDKFATDSSSKEYGAAEEDEDRAAPTSEASFACIKGDRLPSLP